MLKRKLFACLSACASLALVSSAAAVVNQRLTEDFTQKSNEGQWSFPFPTTIVEESGKSYLYTSGLDTFAPQLDTAPNQKSIFTGNYVAQKVKSIDMTTQIFSDLSPQDDKPLTLILTSGNYAAYKSSDKLVVASLNRWESYHFDIPKSAAEAAKQGWHVTTWPRMGGSATPDKYDAILQNVDHVQFYYGDPVMFYMFQNWDLGVTDISITKEN